MSRCHRLWVLDSRRMDSAKHGLGHLARFWPLLQVNGFQLLGCAWITTILAIIYSVQIAAVACRAEFRGRSLSSTNDLNIATCRGFEIFVLGSLGRRYCNRAMALSWNDKWGDTGASRTLSSNAFAANHGCIRVGQGLGQREAASGEYMIR